MCEATFHKEQQVKPRRAIQFIDVSALGYFGFPLRKCSPMLTLNITRTLAGLQTVAPPAGRTLQPSPILENELWSSHQVLLEVHITDRCCPWLSKTEILCDLDTCSASPSDTCLL
jgi:hypothetical protein